jgi:uncharacterized membrane protein
MIEEIALARAIHVLSIVHWMGGVAVVTTIILPSARRLPTAAESIAAFEAFERPFASQARISIFLAGASGAYMVWKLNVWSFLQLSTAWWLHLMIAVWVLFALMVYVLEPLIIHRRFHAVALRSRDRAFRSTMVLHAIALFVSACAIVAGVLGAHGALP